MPELPIEAAVRGHDYVFRCSCPRHQSNSRALSHCRPSEHMNPCTLGYTDSGGDLQLARTQIGNSQAVCETAHSLAPAVKQPAERLVVGEKQFYSFVHQSGPPSIDADSVWRLPRAARVVQHVIDRFRLPARDGCRPLLGKSYGTCAGFG